MRWLAAQPEVPAGLRRYCHWRVKGVIPGTPCASPRWGARGPRDDRAGGAPPGWPARPARPSLLERCGAGPTVLRAPGTTGTGTRPARTPALSGKGRCRGAVTSAACGVWGGAWTWRSCQPHRSKPLSGVLGDLLVLGVGETSEVGDQLGVGRSVGLGRFGGAVIRRPVLRFAMPRYALR